MKFKDTVFLIFNFHFFALPAEDKVFQCNTFPKVRDLIYNLQFSKFKNDFTLRIVNF